MNKTWKVLRYELVSAVTRRSFLLISFGIPLVTILIFAVLGILKNDIPAGSDEETAQQGLELKVEGYVDPSALIQTIPSDLPDGVLIPYPDEESAMQARQAGEISAYYLSQRP
jgi:ABC-type Na+ efflux pump permease subunit